MGINNQVFQFLENFFSTSDLNKLPKNYGGGRIFNTPVIGISQGDDPIFLKYKKIIGPKHLTPIEVWLDSGFPNKPDLSSELRILSIICPYVDKIRQTGSKAVVKRDDVVSSTLKNGEKIDVVLPAEIYSIGRNFANPFKIEVVKQSIGFFRNLGFNAIGGAISNAFNLIEFKSNWSERHIAFAAGLGTFSLHEGFISEVGCNIRITSVITDAPLKVTPRTSDEPYGNCLYYIDGSCRKCEENCPGAAIDENGHDKLKCWTYGNYIKLHMNDRFGSLLKPHSRRVNGEIRKYNYMNKKAAVGCAFCQFNVPCMDKNPSKIG
jgi:hypothetical protein